MITLETFVTSTLLLCCCIFPSLLPPSHTHCVWIVNLNLYHLKCSPQAHTNSIQIKWTLKAKSKGFNLQPTSIFASHAGPASFTDTGRSGHLGSTRSLSFYPLTTPLQVLSSFCLARVKPEKQEDRQGIILRSPHSSPFITAILNIPPAEKTRFKNEMLTANHQETRLIFIHCWKIWGFFNKGITAFHLDIFY